jgi:Flp pilus assembly protein TadD
VEDRLSVNPGDPEALGALGLYRARLGDRGQALPITAKAQSLGPANRSVRWHAALAYELCGRREEALQALAAAVRLGQPLNEVRNEPALAALRGDARFQRLIAGQPAR